MQGDLRLGSAVRVAGDEHVGTLTRILVDDAGELDAIVVRLDVGLSVEALLADAPEVSVPADQVESATEDGVMLRITREELGQSPEYLEERAPRPGEQWTPPPGYTLSDLLSRLALLLGGGANQPPLVAEYEKPETEHQIALHAPALVGDQRIGEITRVLYDAPTGQVRALVLRREHLEEELLLPADLLESVADDAVQVRLTPQRLRGLERFRP